MATKVIRMTRLTSMTDAELSKNFWCLLTLSVARLLEDRFRWNCEKFGRKIEGCWPAERTLRLAATFGRLVIGIAPTLLSVKERKVIWARVTIFLQFYQYFPGFRFKWTSFRIECTSVCSLSRSRFNASSHSTWTRFGIELDTATKGGPSKGPPPPLIMLSSGLLQVDFDLVGKPQCTMLLPMSIDISEVFKCKHSFHAYFK